MTKVSVIVAVYNGERTISRCIDSLLAQTLRECEIIVVDDGSTDGTREILEAYKQRNEQLALIFHSENKGQREAQYHGYMASTGEYISGVDADDWVSPTRFESLYKLTAFSPVVVSGATRIRRDGQHSPFTKGLRTGFVDIADFINVLYGEPWDKLIKRELLFEGLKRYELFFGENSWHQSGNMPIFWAMYGMGKIFYSEQSDYYYSDTPNSRSKRVSLDLANQGSLTILRRFCFLSSEFPEHSSLIARRLLLFMEILLKKFAPVLIDDKDNKAAQRYEYVKNILVRAL